MVMSARGPESATVPRSARAAARHRGAPLGRVWRSGSACPTLSLAQDTFADRHMPVTATAGQASLGPGPPSVTRQTYKLALSFVLHLVF